ncbi:MAG: glycosyltransferase family 39 protein [Crocinitomicaceae bacterium]|nr:glycosyltransferase family 39 protein [Crocinitomicaceae bacterium]
MISRIKFQNIKDHIENDPGRFLFFLFLLIACFTYQHYGVSWDEHVQRKTGIISYNYAFDDDKSLLEWKDKDYGVAFELPLIIVERGLNITDSRQIYLMRHFLSHLLFLVAALCLYRLIFLLTKSKWLSSIGFLLLVMHPTIYSHSFFNSKDIPFLSMMTIVFYFSARAFATKSITNFIYLGICTALLIDMRIMGIMIPFIIIGFLIIDLISEKNYSNNLLYLFLFLLSTTAVTYIAWPYLWNDPINNFLEAYENASKFRFESATWFNGEFVPTWETPWYYFPVWFLISTPILFTVLLGFGILVFLFLIVTKFKQFLFNNSYRNYVMYFTVLGGTITLVIYHESVMYDSWRQLYFLYIPMILFMILGIEQVKFQKIQKGIQLAVFITFGFLAIHSIRQYPLQYVYFNRTVDHTTYNDIRNHWEMDYWGVSYYPALKYILEHDDTDQILVGFDHMSVGLEAHKFLPEDQRVRYQFRSDWKETDYFITMYRWHPWDYEDIMEHEFYNFTYGNNKFCTIFKIKK